MDLNKETGRENRFSQLFSNRDSRFVSHEDNQRNGIAYLDRATQPGQSFLGVHILALNDEDELR